MSTTIKLPLQRLPAMPLLLMRAALARPQRDSDAQPQLQASVANVAVSPRQLARYRDVCGFDGGSDVIPATYPHILAFRLHLAMLTHRQFPMAPMGMIHLRNSIRQYRPIRGNERFDLECAITDYRLVSQGTEFDIRSYARIGGELVWEDLSVNLAPGKGNGQRDKKTPPPMPDYPNQESWSLPANLGRRYARASGDYNPIHLHPATAKLLGFRRHIAHGMWSKARCLAALQPLLDVDAFEIAVDFKTPVFLPCTVVLHHGRDDSGIVFDLRNEAGTRPHLAGRLMVIP